MDMDFKVTPPKKPEFNIDALELEESEKEILKKEKNKLIAVGILSVGTAVFSKVLKAKRKKKKK